MHENGINVDSRIDLTLSSLEEEGKTAILVSIDSKLSGIVAMADTIKESANEAVRFAQEQDGYRADNADRR